MTKVICTGGCRRIFDITDDRIVFIPFGYGQGSGRGFMFQCLDCLLEDKRITIAEEITKRGDDEKRKKENKICSNL